MTEYRRIEAPTIDVMSLDAVKQQARIDLSAEDALVGRYIVAAGAALESYYSVSLRPQKWEAIGTTFDDVCRLKFGPVVDVDEIKYFDSDNVEVTLAPASYAVVNRRETYADLVSAYEVSWPAYVPIPGGIRVQYSTGHTTVPPEAEMAAALLIGHWYRNRESVVVGSINQELRHGVERLMRPLGEPTP